jgi:hypothetical protein
MQGYAKLIQYGWETVANIKTQITNMMDCLTCRWLSFIRRWKKVSLRPLFKTYGWYYDWSFSKTMMEDWAKWWYALLTWLQNTKHEKQASKKFLNKNILIHGTLLVAFLLAKGTGWIGFWSNDRIRYYRRFILRIFTRNAFNCKHNLTRKKLYEMNRVIFTITARIWYVIYSTTHVNLY